MKLKRRTRKDIPKRRRRVKSSIFRIARFVFLYIPLLLFILSLCYTVILKWAPVPYTPLMAIRAKEYKGDDNFETIKKWTPLENISADMVMAVIASEDNRFDDHKGFDWVEIDNAIEERRSGKRIRGASTISQQTAKNVFLYPSRSWVRKGLESYFTVAIELIWGKERIMEVYLNVAEMGKGVYGAEAAANVSFGKTAQKLTGTESALIAATLPDPLKRSAKVPSPYVRSRAADIERLMTKIKRPEWIEK